MNFKRRGPTGEGDVKIDLTPMVDCIFNLLIFYAVSTTFITTPGIKINLPKASAQELIPQKEELIVALTIDNKIFVNQRQVSLEDLEDTFLKAAKKSAETTVVIQADKDVTHGQVVTVMDLAKRSGLSRLAIATQTPAGKELVQ